MIESRSGADPGTSYVARLFAKGPDAILKKIGEEATETVMAAKDGDRASIVAEVADLWFHSMIALAHFGLHRPTCSPSSSGARGCRGSTSSRCARRGREGGHRMNDVVDSGLTPERESSLSTMGHIS